MHRRLPSPVAVSLVYVRCMLRVVWAFPVRADYVQKYGSAMGDAI
jgi:hypothetical protein